MADNPKEPYGDVHYGDPGFQPDKKKRYPLDTAKHVTAAWDYFHHKNDRAKYSPTEQHHIESEIRSAAAHFGIHLSDDKSVEGAEVKAPAATGGGDRAMLQAAHDAIVHLAGGPGNLCIQMVTDEDPTGASDGANRSVDDADTKDLESFEKALDDVLSPTDSPVESPATEAAAPSDEERAPADVAADDAADELAIRARALMLSAPF